MLKLYHGENNFMFIEPVIDKQYIKLNIIIETSVTVIDETYIKINIINET